MDPTTNPFAPGAGSAPPALTGRDEVIRSAEIALQRIRDGRSEKSQFLLGLRGVGKTVLLNHIGHRAEELGYHIVPLEAPEGSGWPRVASFPSMPELERALGRPLYPQIVLLDADQPDGYVREWRPPGLPPERHLGYAVQWYSLATALVVIWIVVNTRRTAE